MIFSSIVFICYFLPVFLLVYFLASKSMKNWVILAGSIFFYAWGAPRFIFVILGTTFIDFHLVRAMDESTSDRKRKALLFLSVCINLGLLVYFKYSNFFIDNLNLLLDSVGMNTMPWMKLALPIGISFYTFETLTYVIDVYRRVHAPLKRFWDYQLYIILFPKLIAGPIIRYHDIADQIYDRSQYETADFRLRGLYRFIIGLSKKVLLANAMGNAAESIFAIDTANLSTTVAWIGALSYTFQIYFDFSGYSDMAIGIGMMMGFRFPENFNNPYTAISITDFWRKWHITLGTWMRNYLYIPLGGNKVNSKARLYFNLWIVFLASGLWHGAAWGFIIWGAYHGLFLVLERMFLQKWLQKAGKAAAIYTFLVVMIGWVFFRLEEWTPSVNYLQIMFGWHKHTAIWIGDNKFWTILGLCFLFSFFNISNIGQRIQDSIFIRDYKPGKHLTMTLVTIILTVLCLGSITTSNFNPFIYFRF